ncbi:hypothetical protein PR001_g19786 [Phytophthora rubi]|uniref:WLGC domain-containing protein n=1 Tax=Phytophthora rubi TaxID=129364 RepID=A0A6A3JY81_9STRA|nr:hypothetical protein PR001_g19786 [Phytophthora rubi]
MVREADKENHRLIFTFREAFGILGVPILGTLVACIAWTTWLIYIALAPNQAANWLMGTSTYDNGQFWSIIDTTPVMTNIGAACLVLVDLCYLYVVVKMLRWRTTVARLYATSSRPHEDIRVDPTTDSWIRTASDRVKTNYHELTSFRGSKRKFWMTVLLELLETGSPAALVYGYTGFISVGSLAGAVKILVGRFSAMGEIIAGSIHLEGKPDSQNLVTLPEDLFTDMPWLSAVHIGFHPNLANIPALSGVPNLKGLTLAWMLILTELPSFDRVPLLEHLLLTFLPHLERMPDMAPLRLVSNFSLSRAVQLCCNGFLGACDLNDSYCAYNPAAGIPAASCLDEEPFLGNMGTRDMFKKFESVVCQKQPSDMFLVGSTPTRQTIEMCDRRPFGQCQTPDGRTGICYNTRLQVLSCCGDENYIELRRYQIQLGVGQKCDPELEKWLGCEDEHKIVQ